MEFVGTGQGQLGFGGFMKVPMKHRELKIEVIDVGDYATGLRAMSCRKRTCFSTRELLRRHQR